MLLAEIHGKRCPDIEGLEDLFTSAVFGHLRWVPPNVFWSALFKNAWTLEAPAHSLQEKLQSLDIDLSKYDSLDIAFWKNFEVYGEPDLICCFAGSACAPILLLIEVKLYSGKSGLGENDQLAKYLRLLEDMKATTRWQVDKDHRFVIYLTRNFASEEIEDSLKSFAAKGGDARPILFGLEWRDILKTATAFSAITVGTSTSKLLSEVAHFLKIRGIDGFNGFPSFFPLEMAGGRFYQRLYFKQHELRANVVCGGHFYGN